MSTTKNLYKCTACRREKVCPATVSTIKCPDCGSIMMSEAVGVVTDDQDMNWKQIIEDVYTRRPELRNWPSPVYLENVPDDAWKLGG
jgi:DNA-directed RNA polymerase subunit RPC12/RpoP